MTAPNPRAAAAPTRAWIGLAALVLAATLVSMDLSVLFLALPYLSEALEPSGTQLLWITDIYGFMLGGLLLTMGTLGDRIGRRRLLIGGAALFGLASAIAAFAPTAELLVAARALLGVAGATLAPSTLALIRNMFHDPRQRRTAIGVWTAGFSGGGALGPVIGGVLLEHFWWGSVFLINVPVMAALLVAAPLLLPEFRAARAGRFDLLSAAMSLAAVLAVIYGIKRLAEHGADPAAAAAVLLGTAIGVLFVRRQRRLADPMIDVGLFRSRAFSTAVAVNALTMFALMGSGILTAQFLQSVLGMRPLVAALWSTVPFLAVPIGVTVATLAVRRLRPAAVVGAGLFTTAAGFLVMTRVTTDGGPLLLIAGSAVMAAGVGMVSTLANDLVVATAPPERAGAASALSETGSEFGGALGIAALGTLSTAIYQAQVASDAPQGIPAAVLHTAGETIGAALHAAASLPGSAGERLADVAREAFTAGLHASTAAAGALLATAAVVVLIVLRDLRTEQVVHQEDEDEDADGGGPGAQPAETRT
ncbi:MFS transporter [Murinocardiopsis flavida]|nr:MFS transporter [Murinocardiopsis flavida]